MAGVSKGVVALCARFRRRLCWLRRRPFLPRTLLCSCAPSGRWGPQVHYACSAGTRAAGRASSSARSGGCYGRATCTSRTRPTSGLSEFSQAGVFVRAFGKDAGGSGVEVRTSSCRGGQPAAARANSKAREGRERIGRRVCLGPRATIGSSEFTHAGVFVQAFGKDVGGSGVDVCTSSCAAGTRVTGRASSTARRRGGGERIGRHLDRGRRTTIV